METFEFLVPGRPVSQQGKNRSKRRSKDEWKAFVCECALQEWEGTPVYDETLRFTLVYLCEDRKNMPDINNIIKPVQDALIGLIYLDDNLIVDVQGHLRMADDVIAVTELPALLQDVIVTGTDCLYVRVDSSPKLGDLL